MITFYPCALIVIASMEFERLMSADYIQAPCGRSSVRAHGGMALLRRMTVVTGIVFSTVVIGAGAAQATTAASLGSAERSVLEKAELSYRGLVPCKRALSRFLIMVPPHREPLRSNAPEKCA